MDSLSPVCPTGGSSSACQERIDGRRPGWSINGASWSAWIRACADGRSRLDGERRAVSRYRRTAGLLSSCAIDDGALYFARCTYLYVRIHHTCVRAVVHSCSHASSHCRQPVTCSKIFFFLFFFWSIDDPHIYPRPRVRWSNARGAAVVAVDCWKQPSDEDEAPLDEDHMLLHNCTEPWMMPTVASCHSVPRGLYAAVWVGNCS